MAVHLINLSILVGIVRLLLVVLLLMVESCRSDALYIIRLFLVRLSRESPLLSIIFTCIHMFLIAASVAKFLETMTVVFIRAVLVLIVFVHPVVTLKSLIFVLIPYVMMVH